MIRITGLLILAATVVLAAGCKTTVAPAEMGPDAIRTTAGAAGIARARARYIGEEIEMLLAERAELLKRRKALLKEADDYRERVFIARRDPHLRSGDRKAREKMWADMAATRDRRALTMLERARAHASQAGTLEGKRQCWLKEAGRLEGPAASMKR